MTRRSGSQETYDLNSPPGVVNRVLMEKYNYSLTFFENTLPVVKTHFDLLRRKRSSQRLEKNISDLETSKNELVKTIDGFFTKSISWNWISNEFEGMQGLRDKNIEDSIRDRLKADFIRDQFHLNYYNQFIDNRIRLLRNKERMLNSINLFAKDRRKLVGLQTMLVLVWIHAFKTRGASNNKSYAETNSLLKWFSKNRKPMLRDFHGQLISLNLDTIRRNYERYILQPTDSRKVFGDLAIHLYETFFEDFEIKESRKQKKNVTKNY